MGCCSPSASGVCPDPTPLALLIRGQAGWHNQTNAILPPQHCIHPAADVKVVLLRTNK
ncbi:hypothetical protein GCM10027361_29650 [Erwinia aphidicola]